MAVYISLLFTSPLINIPSHISLSPIYLSSHQYHLAHISLPSLSYTSPLINIPLAHISLTYLSLLSSISPRTYLSHLFTSPLINIPSHISLSPIYLSSHQYPLAHIYLTYLSLLSSISPRTYLSHVITSPLINIPSHISLSPIYLSSHQYPAHISLTYMYLSFLLIHIPSAHISLPSLSFLLINIPLAHISLPSSSLLTSIFPSHISICVQQVNVFYTSYIFIAG